MSDRTPGGLWERALSVVLAWDRLMKMRGPAEKRNQRMTFERAIERLREKLIEKNDD